MVARKGLVVTARTPANPRSRAESTALLLGFQWQWTLALPKVLRSVRAAELPPGLRLRTVMSSAATTFWAMPRRQ